MTTLDELRREHAEQVIGAHLSDLLTRIVHSTAPAYPASEYSDAGVWNRASLDDAAQDWIASRLLERGDLALMLSAAKSLNAFRAMLTRSFSQHLVNQRRRTSATNFFSRAAKMLSTDDGFVRVSGGKTSGDARWCLREQHFETPASGDTVQRLIKASFSISDEQFGVVHYGPYSLKSSPILRNPQLRSFLEWVLGSTDGHLSIAEIFEIARHRFKLFGQLPPLELPDELQADDESVVRTVESQVLAQSVIARLSPEDRAKLGAVAKSEVSETLQDRAQASVERLVALIADYAVSADEAIAVHRRVYESLYEEAET